MAREKSICAVCSRPIEGYAIRPGLTIDRLVHSGCLRALREDHEPIKAVPGAQREAWEPRRTGYTAEDFKRDRHAS